jgi:hypothetical protein
MSSRGLRSIKDQSKDSESFGIAEEERESHFDTLYKLLNEAQGMVKSSYRPAENVKPKLPTRQVRGYEMDEEGKISLNPIPLKNVASRFSLDDPLMQSAHNDRQIPDAYTVRNF